MNGYVMNGDDEASDCSYRISVIEQESISINDIDTGLTVTYDSEFLLGAMVYYLHISGVIGQCHRNFIRRILVNVLGVPFRAVNDTIALIYEIGWCTVSAVKVIEADVRIQTYYGMDRALALSADDFLRPAPASREAVEALEKVVIDVKETSCMVCLEELSLGSEATKMPCSHVFHSECIVNWLENRFVCPLCRFELPSATGY